MNKAQSLLSLITEADYDYRHLKRNKVMLTPEEHDEVLKSGAVWDHPKTGEKTPGIWKAKTRSGITVYGSNTHRAISVKKSLSDAIKSFSWIKSTS